MCNKRRCLIVDDEDLILERLEQFFVEFSDAYELVGKAYSGEDAIAMALSLNPDIVITDIVMPGMDGISLIEQLKNIRPATMFIILTAYSDFDYAKNAIRLNVLDYMVKVPLNKQDLFHSLQKADRALKEKEAQEGEIRRLNRSRMEHVQRIRKQVFTELISREISASDAERFASEMGIDHKLRRYCCFIVELGDQETFQRIYNKADQNALRYAMLNIFEETMTEQGAQGFACDSDAYNMFGIVYWPSMHSMSATNQNCMRLGEQMISNIQNYLKKTISVGFSSAYDGWSMIANSYHQALQALENAYYWHGGVCFTQVYHTAYTGEKEKVDALLEQIYENMKPEVDPEVLLRLLQQLKNYIEQHPLPKSIMTSAIQRTFDAISGKMKLYSKDVPHLYDGQMEQMNFTRQWKHLERFISTSIASLQETKRNEIVKAKRYIEGYLKEQLTLREVAAHVGLARTYFSSLFKKEEGVGLIDYINQRRVERAAELLTVGNYTNQELGDAVGIYNERYFCTLFKERFGTTPQKYGRK